MKLVSLLAALAAPWLWSQAVPLARAQAPSDAAQWRVSSVRYCPQADSLFGRMWRSHASGVRVAYSRAQNVTLIRTPDRRESWQTTASRLVGTEALIRVPGQGGRTDSGRVELVLRFVDSIYRTAEQAHLQLRIDDSVSVDVPEPAVDYPMGAKISGIPLAVTASLTPEQSLALARAHEVKGTMGPFPFIFYDWEIWDINSVYRGSRCGIS